MASSPLAQRDAYGEERRNSDIPLTSNPQPVLPTYENSTDPTFRRKNRDAKNLPLGKTAILFYVAIYTALAIAGWVIVCQAAFGDISQWSDSMPSFCNPQRLRAARVLSSIAGLLTIPMTSAACAYAAVNYIQYSPRRQNDLTLRQSLALANKGWADPKILFSLLSLQDLKKTASPLLCMAIVINVIGFIVYPLQQLLVGKETAVVEYNRQWEFINDIPDLYGEAALGSPDRGEITEALRSALSTTTRNDRLPHLWQNQVPDCRDPAVEDNYKDSDWCYDFAGTDLLLLDDYPNLRQPFVAQLPYKFSTGTGRYYAPRINSSVTYETVPDDQFTQKCSEADWFNVTYHISNEYGFADLKACMPGNLTASPFKNQRGPQQVEEVLYIKATVDGYAGASSIEPTAYKVGMRTTVGYFELPNFMNNQAGGPLLDTDPTQLDSDNDFDDDSDYGDDSISNERQFGLVSVPGKGPLAEITLALFGNGSFIDDLTNPNYTVPESLEYLCRSNPPMGRLVDDYEYDGCVTPGEATSDVANWMNMFTDAEVITQRLTNAAVLTNTLHITGWPYSYTGGSLDIYHDVGLFFERPTMSLATMIVISVLLGLYLLSIFALALYASFQSSWNENLDAFAMLRMGSALSDRGDLFAVTRRFGKTGDPLDTLPGYIGDMKPDDRDGMLGVGGQGPLVRQRMYHVSDI